QLELVGAIERHHQPDCKQAARMPRQAGTRPDFTPCVTGDQRLELGVEVVALRERTLDMGIAKHRLAYGETVLVSLVFVHSLLRAAGEKLHERLRECRRRLDVRQ